MEKQYKSEKKKKTSLEQCQEKGQTSGKKLEVKVSRELEQHEAAALKTAMREFAEVLLPYFGIEDLKRFRMYEAMASYQYKVEITTYVLYSGNI